MKKITLLIFFLIFNGCFPSSNFVYNLNSSRVLDPQLKNLKVAVLPFEDHRDFTNRVAGLRFFIPGVLYGFQDYSRINEVEANGIPLFKFKPTEDLAKALTKELIHNKIFHEVFYISPMKKIADVDFYIKGEIHSTKFFRKFYSYGVSIYFTPLWFLGFPAKQVKIYLSLNIKLIRADTQKEVWSYEINREWKKLIGAYYNIGDDHDGYSIILQEEYKKLIFKLNEDIKAGLLD